MEKIVTALEIENPPRIPALLYRDVIGPHVKIASDLVLPLSKGMPVGDPIAEILLTPHEKTHRLAYRAVLRDAVARRIRALGGKVDKKDISFCSLRLIYDITLSGDKRILMLFP